MFETTGDAPKKPIETPEQEDTHFEPYSDSQRPQEIDSDMPELPQEMEEREYTDSDRPEYNGELPLDENEYEKVNSDESGLNDSKYLVTDGVVKYANSENTDSSEDDVKKIKCRNEDLEGKHHPETGVLFEKRIVEVNGVKYEVVVPKFESVFDAQLPENMYEASDNEQFAECNKQLKEAVDKDPELKSKFTDEQLEQIADGETPDGYTWHHDAETGKMQLVDTETHQKTGHTGGRSIWGGGSDKR